MPRLLIVTPARDEAANLPRLAAALKAQSVPVDVWLVIENGSTDGTHDFLATLQPEGAVRTLAVIHEDTHDNPAYALGSKYARLIARGMSWMRDLHGLNDADFFGILDADVIPEPDYYRKLLDAFAHTPRLGLTSGLTVDDSGKPSAHRRSWVRGSCRVWRGACLNEAGYPIGPSADSLSAIKAEIRGWTVDTVPTARAQARTVGDRVKFGYYGQSAYIRGETLLHCLLRSGKYAVLKGQPVAGWQFFRGYIDSRSNGVARIDDPEILAWSRGAVWRALKKFVAGKTGRDKG